MFIKNGDDPNNKILKVVEIDSDKKDNKLKEEVKKSDKEDKKDNNN